jgi:mannosyltransferase
MRLDGRSAAIVLIAIAAVAAVLRAISLNDGLWFDEILTLVLFARPPLERIVTEYPNSNNHPLYSILAHVSMAGFGEHAWSLRLPAMIFGVAAVPAVYAVARLVSDRRESLLAAALMAVSYHAVWFRRTPAATPHSRSARSAAPGC